MANRNEKGTTLLRGKRTATQSFSHFDSRPCSESSADDRPIFLFRDARADKAAGVVVSECSVSMSAVDLDRCGAIARHGMASVAALDDRNPFLRRVDRREGSGGAKASGRHACTGLYLYLAI
ncbi:MAG: hypothetical protein R3F22_11190 [Lysobacteraceae bacterium]